MANEQSLLDHLRAAAETGRLGPLVIECWIGGGQPPPYYRSEAVRLLTVDGAPIAELATLRFARKLTPQDVIERYRRPISPDIVRATAQHLLDANLFELTLPEEKDSGVSSGLRYEYSLRLAKNELKKTYYLTMPESLGRLNIAFNRLAIDVRASGARTWLQQGQPITEPDIDVPWTHSGDSNGH